MEAIISDGKRVGLHTVIGRIAGGSDVSLHLFESFGFRHIGIMKEVGRKFGRQLDVHLMQKIYPDVPYCQPRHLPGDRSDARRPGKLAREKSGSGKNPGNTRVTGIK